MTCNKFDFFKSVVVVPASNFRKFIAQFIERECLILGSYIFTCLKLKDSKVDVTFTVLTGLLNIKNLFLKNEWSVLKVFD